MARTLLTSLALIMCMLQGYAQTPLAPDAAVAPCFVATEEATWTAIGLDAEQLERVKTMQTACKTDCALTPETTTTEKNLSGAVLKLYEAQLEELLTTEQYTKWTQWCDQRPRTM
jgi:hypothetical protein